MLLQQTIRNLGRVKACSSLFKHQLRRLDHLTPIAGYQNFHRNGDEIFRRTGFMNEKPKGNCILGLPNQLNLPRSIHSHGALYFKYSNLLEQKVSENEKKIEDVDKSADAVKQNVQNVNNVLEETRELGLFARFKRMAKDYWYVLIPVHVATSCIWLGSFYYASKSGVDIVGILEYYNFSETITKHLKDSHLGHVAIAYFLYKIATPARYTVTLGGTTFAIKFLSKRGIIKPMPTKDQLVQIYKDKKDDLHQKVQQKVADKKQDFEDKKQAFQDKYMKKE